MSANRSEHILKTSRQELLEETEVERVTRMNQEAGLREERRRLLTEELMRGMTFSPYIDPLSQRLGRESSFEELNKNSRGKKVREDCARKVMEERDRECTFAPRINSYSRNMLELTQDDLWESRYESRVIGMGLCYLIQCIIIIN